MSSETKKAKAKSRFIPPRNNPYVREKVEAEQKKNENEDKNKEKIQITDYLKQMRNMRTENERRMGVKAKLEDWQKYNNNENLSLNEKYSYIMQSAQKIENYAHMKELTANDPDDHETINDMYVQSIRAKLALLEKLN